MTRKITHDGHANTYSFLFNNTKIVLQSSRDICKPKPIRDSTNLLSLAQFEEEVRDTGLLYVSVGKKTSKEVEILEAIAKI